MMPGSLPARQPTFLPQPLKPTKRDYLGDAAAIKAKMAAAANQGKAK